MEFDHRRRPPRTPRRGVLHEEEADGEADDGEAEARRDVDEDAEAERQWPRPLWLEEDGDEQAE